MRLRISGLALAGTLVLAAGASAMDPVEERLSREDLTAQQGMWRATDGMVMVSMFQMLVGVAGTVAVLASLAESRRAVALTRTTLALQHRTAQQELRAYLSVVPKDPGIDATGNGRINVKVKNFGQTPARNVQRWTNRKWLDEVPDAVPMSFPETFKFREWRDIAPSADADIFSELSLKANTMLQLSQGNKSLIEYGVVVYEDIFGARHAETWCFIRYGDRLQTRKRNKSFNPEHEIIKNHLDGGVNYTWPDFELVAREGGRLSWLIRLLSKRKARDVISRA